MARVVHRRGALETRTASDAYPACAPRESDRAFGLIVVIPAAMIGLSLVLTLLAAWGYGGLLPVAMRAAIVVTTAVLLPGLPIAGLLRLPRNGIFASVVISISLAVNIILSQLAAVAGFWHPYAQQLLILCIAAAATALAAKGLRTQSRVDVTSSFRRLLNDAGFSVRQVSRGSSLLAAASVILFFISISELDADQAEAYGLVQILGVSYFIGLGCLCTALVLEFRRRVLDCLMLAVTNVVLIMYMAMPLAWAYEIPSFPTAFVHRHITNWISDLGALPPAVDARLSWAGFFTSAAHLMSIGSLDDSSVFLTSASLVFGVLLMFPVYALGRALSGSSRTGWLSVTIFALFNWYQQDYFAPQAIAMQLYVTVLAVLLWQLRMSPLPAVGMLNAWRRVPGRPRVEMRIGLSPLRSCSSLSWRRWWSRTN